ncbi:unnamed protein product [Zymoseptoria tritici ST99CH_1A5]|uniref:Uncharacterized protein n=1 Tax=Zymoseptoria tritici ST99CH_1A5 TaxID=1276529 RepID=A0A1Y6LCA2_ZYMTR|nr:unnamed protein product [Zymoseptoria tritici ST99CH_1A5]
MLSFKSQSGDKTKTPDSRGSSLRRFSSIASFQTLNPFHRRRSNNTTDSPSSNVSQTSITAEAHQTPKAFSSPLIEPVPPPPPMSMLSNDWPARRSSYVCLPDDPIGGMPRSRTFSNLPLPTRVKRVSNPLQSSKSNMRLPSMMQSKSHARLPSLQHSTRIPSPVQSHRKYSTSRLPVVDHRPSVDNRSSADKRRLPRSDTMPLLYGHDNNSSFSRSTALEENISLNPIRPVSTIDMTADNTNTYGASSVMHRTNDYGRAWQQTENRRISRPSQSHSSSVPFPSFEQHTADLTAHPQKNNSSPIAFRSSRDRPGTPGQSVQRWNSQPVLSNTTNINRYSHGEIKQARLMSARQAPTPPPPKTPVAAQVLNSSSNLRLVSHASDHIRHLSEQISPARMSLTGQLRSRANSVNPNVALSTSPAAPAPQIFCAEPFAYWTGRFSTLNDRYRNEELLESIPGAGPKSPETRSKNDSAAWPSKSSTDKMHTCDANARRMRRAVFHLYQLCGNQEARESFFKWQKQLAAALGLPELGRPIGDVTGESQVLQVTLKEDAISFAGISGSGTDSTAGYSKEGSRSRIWSSSGTATGSIGSAGKGNGSGRKSSFMEKLLGRRKSGTHGLAVGVA